MSTQTDETRYAKMQVDVYRLLRVDQILDVIRDTLDYTKVQLRKEPNGSSDLWYIDLGRQEIEIHFDRSMAVYDHERPATLSFNIPDGVSQANRRMCWNILIAIRDKAIAS